MSFVSNSTLNMTANSTSELYGRWKPIPVVFWSFLAVLDLMIIIGNAFFFWLFIRYKSLRHKSNYFVLSLAIADFLVGLSVPPCEYCAVLSEPLLECQLGCGAALSFNMAASVMNLSLIAYERVLAVKFPFRYHAKMTKTRIYKLIICAWIMASIFSILPFTWTLLAPINESRIINHVYVIVIFGLIVTVGILIHIAYYVIIKEAKEKAKVDISHGYHHGDAAGLKVCMVLATIFLLCWIPMAVYELIIDFEIHASFPKWSFDAAYFILLINPCLDPLLYAYYKREMKKAATKQFQAWFKCLRQTFPFRKISSVTPNGHNKSLHCSSRRTIVTQDSML